MSKAQGERPKAPTYVCKQCGALIRPVYDKTGVYEDVPKTEADLECERRVSKYYGVSSTESATKRVYTGDKYTGKVSYRCGKYFCSLKCGHTYANRIMRQNKIEPKEK